MPATADALFASKLERATELVALRRGADELVLVNAARDVGCPSSGSRFGRPFYCERGGAYVEALLSEAANASSLGAILDARPADAELLRLLVEHGILLAGRRDTRGCASEAGGLSDHASLYLLLSQTCNMACTYCLAGERSYGAGKPPRIALDVALSAIERAFSRVRPGGELEIVFFGGEPMLGWPTARAILDASRTPAWSELAGDRTARFHFTTNLSVLPAEVIDYAKAHAITFLVDVDGPPELHDRTRPLRGGGATHAIIRKHLESLSRAGIGYALRATVTSVNAARMLDVARHHRELGANSSAFVPVTPVNSDEGLVPLELLPDARVYAAGLLEVFEHSGWDAEHLFPFSEFVSRVRQNGRMEQACGAPHGNTPVCDSRRPPERAVHLPSRRALHVGAAHAVLVERLRSRSMVTSSRPRERARS